MHSHQIVVFDYFNNVVQYRRVHDYEAIWTDLRTLSQVWRKVLVPSATEFNNGASRCIYILVRIYFTQYVKHLNIIKN